MGIRPMRTVQTVASVCVSDVLAAIDALITTVHWWWIPLVHSLLTGKLTTQSLSAVHGFFCVCVQAIVKVIQAN